MSRTLKITGNHIKFLCFVLPPISEEAKTRLKFFCSMHNKTIIKFDFCDIQNNQGFNKGYQPQASTNYPGYLNLDYSGYHKNLI